MSYLKRVTSFVAVLVLVSLPRDAHAQRAPVDTLHWLSGCWRLSSPRTTVDEQWMTPNGGVILGMSRTVRGDAVREYEFLRIYASGDTLVYAAMPSGQQPAEFRAPPRSVSPSEIVFENPAHDFPQRIRYRRASGDSLIATVEGDREGKRPPFVLGYRKVACGANAPRH